jgi:hypothetical protein
MRVENRFRSLSARCATLLAMVAIISAFQIHDGTTSLRIDQQNSVAAGRYHAVGRTSDFFARSSGQARAKRR